MYTNNSTCYPNRTTLFLPCFQTPLLRAEDPDSIDLNRLIFSTPPGSLFSVSSNGRVVTTNTVLDREALISQSYIINATVIVTDLAFHTASTTISVTVTDINDNPPCFPPYTLTTFGVEDFRPLFPNPISFVGQVQAVDLDRPEDPLITYFFSGGDRGHFDIDSQTGEIYVIAQLDKDLFDFYVLNVTTTDGNLTCGIQVYINILNPNDQPPIFFQNPYYGSVPEDALFGTYVDVNFTTTMMDLRVAAYRDDIDFNPNITYIIIPQEGVSLPFRLNPITGLLYTNDTLDREREPTYRFTVQANDGLFTATTLVKIVVLNVDDPPAFIHTESEISVHEGTPANTGLLLLKAYDDNIGPDPLIVYEVIATEPSSVSGIYDITRTGGQLFTTQMIPASPQRIYLTISAAVSSTPQLTNTAIVIINVVPRNTGSPVFGSAHYVFDVLENRNGTFVGTVSATGDVTYSIISSTRNDYSNFQIDPKVSDDA